MTRLRGRETYICFLLDLAQEQRHTRFAYLPGRLPSK